jgi:hypothetical protein
MPKTITNMEKYLHKFPNGYFSVNHIIICCQRFVIIP